MFSAGRPLSGGASMKKLVAATLFAVSVSAPALAADMAVKAPMYAKAPVVALYDWTGFYLGANVGIGLGRDRTQILAPTGPVFETTYMGPQGAIGGGQIGYNWQTNTALLGPMVFGLEADIQGSGMRDSRNCFFLCTTPTNLVIT